MSSREVAKDVSINFDLFEKDAASAFLAFLAKAAAFAENLAHGAVGDASLFGELFGRNATGPRVFHNGDGLV